MLDEDGLDLLRVRFTTCSLIVLIGLTQSLPLGVQAMLTYDTTKRISAKRARTHPYFDGLKL